MIYASRPTTARSRRTGACLQASYWESRFRDAVVQRSSIRSTSASSIPRGSARVQASQISLYDVTFSAEVRYIPKHSGELKPFLGSASPRTWSTPRES